MLGQPLLAANIFSYFNCGTTCWEILETSVLFIVSSNWRSKIVSKYKLNYLLLYRFPFLFKPRVLAESEINIEFC